jgi:predicted acyl esterase
MRASPVAQAGAFLPFVGSVAPTDWVEFSTEAFAEDALFIGNPWLELNVTVDRPEGHLSAYLFEVHADGKVEQVSAGWQDLALRTSRDQSEPVPVGQPMPVRVQLLGIAQVVERGHKLVLALAPDNVESLTPRPQVTTFTVQLGGEGGARLVLPAFHA